MRVVKYKRTHDKKREKRKGKEMAEIKWREGAIFNERTDMRVVARGLASNSHRCASLV